VCYYDNNDKYCVLKCVCINSNDIIIILCNIISNIIIDSNDIIIKCIVCSNINNIIIINKY